MWKLKRAPSRSRLLGAGAASGAAAGALLTPILPIAGAAMGATVGYFCGRGAKQAESLAHLPSYEGARQVVPVQLWNPGESAPLTEDGFTICVSCTDRKQVVRFLERVVYTKHGWVENGPMFEAYAMGLPPTATLADVLANVSTWGISWDDPFSKTPEERGRSGL